MFCATTLGLPGKCLPRWRATVRPQRSYPPPGPKPMISWTGLFPVAKGCAQAKLVVRAVRAASASETTHMVACPRHHAAADFPEIGEQNFRKRTVAGIGLSCPIG